ncbi:MAG TPA: squalene/phytoene synthase family protein [Acidimicrobiia bacterium]
MSALPFPIRRLWLLARGALVDRNNPRLGHLASIEDAESFVWAILPHAARSFAPSVLLLPEDDARAAAVGYLYARMLDTYEDLSDDPAQAREALALFAGRFDSERPSAAPPAPRPATPDLRDRTHLLLVESHRLVDEVFMQLDHATRARISRLARDMAAGMIEFSTIFEGQHGVLDDERQVLDYCHRVIGLPALFVMETLLGSISGDHRRDALEVSELIQLANITRDIEKDLQRGVAYHPALRAHLGSNGAGVTAVAVASARRDLILLATRRAASFRRLVDAVGLPRLSPARAAAVLMLLFTGRHYRNCAIDAGMPPRSVSRRASTLILTSLPAAVSPRWAQRVLIRVETDLLATV